MAGAKEGGAFLDEFREAGFREAVMLRTTRNARCKDARSCSGGVCHEVAGQPHAVHVRAADPPSNQILANWPD